MIRFSITIVFLLLFSTVNAQRYSFLTYSTAQGLPQSQVTSIVQDKQGYLWVGTLGGLAKFNGKDFETFTTQDGLHNYRITFLTFINDVLWIGHEGGVSRMDKKGFKKWSLGNDNRKVNVSDIIEFNGKILIASNGGGLFQVQYNQLKKIRMKDASFERIRDLETINSTLYIGTRGGLISTENLVQFSELPEMLGKSVSSVVKHTNKIYITTFKDGFYCFDTGVKELRMIGEVDLENSLRFCFFDSKGKLWLNTTAGIWRMENEKVDLKLDLANGLPMESIQSVFEDNNRNIWFGSDGKGLVRFTGERFVYYNESSGLASDLILTINQEPNGVFWLGTYDKGLVEMLPNGDFNTYEFEDNTVWASLLNVDGHNWFGTGFGLVAMKNRQKVASYLYEDGTPGDKITAFLKISSRSFYVGGSEGVSLYENGKFERLKTGNIETVRSFCKVNGTTYVGTDKGLFIIEGKRLKPISTINKTIYALTKDDANNLWIGTEEGLYKYDGKEFKLISFSTNAASNIINFLEFEDEKLYVGTNNGLFVFSGLKNEFPKIEKFGIGEGVVNLETNMNSSYIDAKGRLWFGTASGMVCFRTKFKTEIEPHPKLVLRNVLLNYQPFDKEKYVKELDEYGLPKELDLPFSRNNITFELDGISLVNYPGLKFQYRLEGLENDWSPVNSNTNVTYRALPAGTYVFHARSVDSQGKFSDEIHIPFVVRPAFYRTWWFIVLSVGLLLGLIYLYFQMRLRREREANEKEKLVFKSRLLSLEQRSLNASMNRHFIFNSLNSIQYFINTQDKLSANRFLTNFAKLIRKNLDSSEEGNMVALNQELERLQLYLSLESMRFRDRFDFEINCDQEIDQETIIIPAMILQPFVENSVIHGILPDEDKKGHISIDIEKEGDILTISIKDNGIGIENSKKSKSDFDGDHRSQGMEITSKRIDLLNKLSNQKFEIIGPYQMEDDNHRINGTCVTLKIHMENLED
jgi:ligand-binding sensor domain-containing protein/two-component sensor histidine kinase